MVNNQQEDEDAYTPQPHVDENKQGLKLYIIKDYRIWARSYEEALTYLPLIESF